MLHRMTLYDDLYRHIRRCHDAEIPGSRHRLLLGSNQVGWVLPDIADRLAALGAQVGDDAVRVPEACLPDTVRALADAGLFRWRDEEFDVRADLSAAWDGAASGPSLARVDRGALPLLGIAAWGAHANGLVRQGDGWRLWVAKRADDRPLDPGKLDHVAAGGVPAGLTPAETLVKEAEEEAGIPSSLSAAARHVGTISYAMEREEGLRRDRIACFDLVLPSGFTPEPHDAEIAHFELWPMSDVLDRVRKTDDFKFNVNLVLIDLFLRTGTVQGDVAERLRAALAGQSDQAATSG